MVGNMAAAGAADGFFRYVYEGCLSGGDMGIERRPYHRNCRCALHNKSKEGCPHNVAKFKNLSYPMRRSWSEGCLALAASASGASGHSSPSSSPSSQAVNDHGGMIRNSSHLGLKNMDHHQEEDDH